MTASSNGSMPSSSGAEIGKTRRAGRLFERLDDLGALLVVEQVGLGQRDHLGLVVEPGAIAVELAAHDPPGARPDRRPTPSIRWSSSRVRSTWPRKRSPIAGALGRALDQAGDVGEHELAALVADDAELRAERREGIVADLGAGVADRVEEGRLAGVGQADEADVGEQLEAQPHPHFLARHRRSGAGAGRGWSRSCSWRCRARPSRP